MEAAILPSFKPHYRVRCCVCRKAHTWGNDKCVLVIYSPYFAKKGIFACTGCEQQAHKGLTFNMILKFDADAAIVL